MGVALLRILMEKFREALVSVAPVALIVILINFTPLVNFTAYEIMVFAACAVLMIIGMGLFSLGAEYAMTPMGEQVGSGLARSGSMRVLLIVCFLMGVFITVAEPDLSVLASQVSNMINSTLLIVTVGVGVGLFLVVSIIKIIFSFFGQ